MTDLQKPSQIAVFAALLILLVGLTAYCFARPAANLDSLAYYSLLESDHHQAFVDSAHICASTVPGAKV